MVGDTLGGRVGEPFTKFRPTTNDMHPDDYRRTKAAWDRLMRHNVKFCGWPEEECISHVLDSLPLLYQSTAASKESWQELIEFLDGMLLPRDKDDEFEAGLDELYEMQIGDMPVSDFVLLIQLRARQLGLSEGVMRYVFLC